MDTEITALPVGELAKAVDEEERAAAPPPPPPPRAPTELEGEREGMEVIEGGGGGGGGGGREVGGMGEIVGRAEEVTLGEGLKEGVTEEEGVGRALLVGVSVNFKEGVTARAEREGEREREKEGKGDFEEEVDAVDVPVVREEREEVGERVCPGEPLPTAPPPPTPPPPEAAEAVRMGEGEVLPEGEARSEAEGDEEVEGEGVGVPEEVGGGVGVPPAADRGVTVEAPSFEGVGGTVSEVRDQSPLDGVGVCRRGEGEVVGDPVTPPPVAVGDRECRGGDTLGEGVPLASSVGSGEAVGRRGVDEKQGESVGLGMVVALSDPEGPPPPSPIGYLQPPPPPPEVLEREGEGVKEGLREELVETKGGRVEDGVSRGDRVEEPVKEMEGSITLGKGEGVRRALGVRVFPPPPPPPPPPLPLPPILGVGVGMSGEVVPPPEEEEMEGEGEGVAVMAGLAEVVSEEVRVESPSVEEGGEVSVGKAEALLLPLPTPELLGVQV